MTKYRSPDHAIKAYFESYNRLSSAKGLEITGMPSSSENVQRNMQEKHADLVLLLAGLTPQEFSCCSLTYASTAGTRTYARFVSSPRDAQPDEKITRNLHPGDATMIEVSGTCSRGYTRAEIAKILRTSQYKVDQMLTSAKTKVAQRLRDSGQEDSP